jgi:hypothetical protein
MSTARRPEGLTHLKRPPAGQIRDDLGQPGDPGAHALITARGLGQVPGHWKGRHDRNAAGHRQRRQATQAHETHARSSAPDHAYYAAVKDRQHSKRAALSEARKIVRQVCHILTELGDDALTVA